jgi:predicted nucleic acid-binding protein
VPTITQTLAQMQGQRVYFDTNILIYVLENSTGYVEACLPFFAAVADGNIVGCTGEMTLAELLVKPMRSNDMVSMAKIRSLFDDGYFETFVHNRSSLELAAHLRATQSLRMIDAIHTAAAIQGNCKFMLTHDKQINRQARGIEIVNIDAWLIPRANS